MASHSLLVPSELPQDQKFVHAALHSFQERNHTARSFRDLSPAEQSAIMRDAQDLKQNAATELERATVDALFAYDVDVHAALAIAKARILQEVTQ